MVGKRTLPNSPEARKNYMAMIAFTNNMNDGMKTNPYQFQGQEDKLLMMWRELRKTPNSGWTEEELDGWQDQISEWLNRVKGLPLRPETVKMDRVTLGPGIEALRADSNKGLDDWLKVVDVEIKAKKLKPANILWLRDENQKKKDQYFPSISTAERLRYGERLNAIEAQLMEQYELDVDMAADLRLFVLDEEEAFARNGKRPLDPGHVAVSKEDFYGMRSRPGFNMSADEFNRLETRMNSLWNKK